MSWAEDEGIDGWPWEDSISDSKKYEWEDRNGNVDLITELKTSHLKNIIGGLNSGKSYLGQEYKLKRLSKELHRRTSHEDNKS